MNDRKRPDYSKLPKGRKRCRVEARPASKNLKCQQCGGKMVVKAPSGSWVAYCPVCQIRIGF